MLNISSQMSAQMQISLLDERGLDLHTGLTSAHPSKPTDGQWMEKNQEFEKEQEVSVTTQCEDKDANANVLQNKNCNGNKRFYECPLCLKRFGAPSKLKRHCLIHTDQRPFQCSICFRAFRERSHLKAHIRTHTNPSSPDAVTPAGKGIFPVSKSSDRMCTLQLKKKSGYQCEICLKKFSFPSKLTRHLFVHFDVKAYTCTICRKSFKQAYYLHKHFKVHTGKRNGNSRLCSVQQKHGAKSPKPGALERTNNCRPDGGNVCLPQILDSLENKKHEKPECQSKLNQKITLPESNSSTVEIKSFDTLKNTEVQITTSSPVYLKHTHKGVNQCSICLKNFPYPSKLARHILSHTDIRPFKCHVCLKSFQFRWHLQCHVRIHKKKGQNIIADHLEQVHTVSFSNAAKSEEQDMQISSQDGAEDSAKVHKDQNTVMESQKMSGDCSNSGVYLEDSLLNKEGLDLHTVLSSAYSSNPSEGQWMEEIQESEEELEASVTTQTEDNDVNVKVLQSKNTDGSKRGYGCPVCHKRFGAPSELKRHCLIHTNQRPFQCSICCRAFRERSHLKVHFRTHTNPVKRRTQSLHSFKDYGVPCNRTSKSRLKPSPNYLTVQNNANSTENQQSTVHQDENVVTENMASEIISGDCSESDAYLQDSLLNKEGLDLHTGLSSAYSSNPSEVQWMEEIQESEEEQEASVTTQTEDSYVNSKVWQSKNSNGSKRVYGCPVCHKLFGAPSELKRHCLIHTNQRPFQCFICCRAFRERSHLKLHFRTHNIPEKRRTPSHQSYRDNSMPCNRASKSRLKPSPKQSTAQDDTKSTDKEKSTVHQVENMVTENMASQIISGDCNKSDAYLQDSLLNKKGLDLHTGLSSAYSSNASEVQWKEEIQEASVTTQTEDNDVNVKVLQNKNTDRNKRGYGCPVCHKRFGAPSELKRHCLIHTNQRPFQCFICCRAFRERSHLKVHIRTHTNPVKRRTRSLHSFKDCSVPCNQTSKSRLKPSPNYLTVQNDANSTENQQSTVHQVENMVTENMASQIICGDCNKSGAYLQDSLLNKKGLDLHTGLSSAYSSNASEVQWKEEIQEASVTTQTEDNDVNVNVLQNKNTDRNKRGYGCPVCHKRFGAPSELKRHCLIHTNQRPFQCFICCRAFRERSHLKLHFRTHNIPEKRRTPSHQSYRDNSMPCNRASKSRLKHSPKQPTAQDDTKSTVHQDENMVTENMASQIISGDCSESDAYLQDSLLNKKGLDLHTGLSSAYSSNASEGQWMEEIQESEEEQEASVTTQTEDSYVNSKMWQSKNSNGSKRVYDCPVCHKRFGAPSELKRHCLIHTNQRPFQCFICCRAFRERSHLKVHIRTHTNPVKRRTRSLHSFKDCSVPCNQTSKSRLKPSPNYLTVQNDANSTENQQSTVHQDENVVTENMASEIISGDCSESDAYLQDSLLNKKGLDLHTGLSSAYSSNPSEVQWKEEIQEASVTTQTEDNDVNVKVLQNKNTDRNKIGYGCPVCHKRFGAPSELKRHCLIHTNQRPFQCFTCCRAFRERSHLKVHFRTHNIPEKRRTPSHQSYRDNSMPCNRASKSRLKHSPKQPTAQDDTKSTVHQDENMVTENMASQIISGDCSESDAYLQDSLLNKKGLDLHTVLSSAYSSNPSEDQWMEEIQESEEEQEASVTTQTEDSYVNSKVWQSKNSNGSKRVYDCPVCHKRFGAPSELKRHCLIHTNQRPFQCFICCRAFRERSHLKVHIRTHTNPVKRRTRSLHSFKDCSVPCNQTSKSRLKPSPNYLTVQNNANSTENQQSTVHQDENMVKENMESEIISGDCSESDAYLQDSLLNKKGLDLHTGLSSAYSSNPSEVQWKEEIQEASVTTQTEDNDVNVNVLQSKNTDRNKRGYGCPVCHKRFGAPSELKRHCRIHTNQRPFQCSVCCRAFRERSHLKVHIRTHNIPEKWRTPSHQSYRDNSVPCNRASKSRLKPSPKYLIAHNDTSSTINQKSTVQQDQNVLTEDMLSQNMSGGCSDSGVYLSKSTSPFENVENKVVFWCNNKSVWGLTHKNDILLDGKKASDIVPFGRVSDCPPKTDSSLPHCAPVSRTEEKWAHHMDDIEDCVFVDSDTVVTQCVPDSYDPSSCQYQQKPDVPRIPEVVVELEDFEDPDECFIKPPHDLPFCPDCNQSFRTIRNLYAHNCANRYPEGEMKKSHQCDICFKFFNAPSKLKRHYVTHTGQRPFQCTQCQKSFTQSHYLKTHMLSHR